MLIGTLPKGTADGTAEATLTPVPLTVNGTATHDPPPTGHSNTLVVPFDVAKAVGWYDSVTMQLPGPMKPPAAPQVLKENPNGTLMPLPDAICT